MPLEGNQMQEGIFVNPDVIDARIKKWLAKLVSSVLKKAGEVSLVPELMVPNPLDAAMGTEGKFYDWGQLVARLKPDGIPTDVQKILPTSVNYSLDEWEVKVGITDRAKINSQMQAQDLLTGGDAARAFARAFDAQGLGTIIANSNSTGGSNWSTETDANVLDQLSATFEKIWDEGFDPHALIMTQKQATRLAKIGVSYATPLTAEQLIKQLHPNLKKIYIWRKIKYKKPDGVEVEMFNPTGYLMVLDSEALGVFTQRPTTVEAKRDTDAGVDFAYLRKYFKTDLVQKPAGHLLKNLVI